MRSQFSSLILLVGLALTVACTVPTAASAPPAAQRDVPAAQKSLSVPPPAAVPAPVRLPVLDVRGGPPGGQASATVRTRPGARCTIEYLTPRGTRSTANGLVEQSSDANGVARWIWVIGSSTAPGSGSVAVTCDGVRVSHPIRIG